MNKNNKESFRSSECGCGNAMTRNAFDGGKGIGSTYLYMSSERLFREAGLMIVGGDTKAKGLEEQISITSAGWLNKDAAYDVILSMVDMVRKTYDFYKKRRVSNEYNLLFTELSHIMQRISRF